MLLMCSFTSPVIKMLEKYILSQWPPSLQVELNPLLLLTGKTCICPCKVIVNISVREVGVLYINERYEQKCGLF